MGNICTRSERDEEALGYFQRTLELDPKNIEAMNNLAIIRRKQGDFQASGNLLNQALEIDPTRADLIYNRGNLEKVTGNISAAVESYKEVIELNPQYIQAYNNLGTIYVDREEFDEAESIYEEGLKADSQNPTLHYNRGVLYQNREIWDKAENDFREALKARPGWEECQNNLGIVLQEQGELEDAKKSFQEILNSDSKNAKVLNNLGVVLSQMGDEKKAEKIYQKAIKLNPDYRNASMNLNQLYSTQKNFSSSLEEMNRLATLYPFDMEIRQQIGRALIRLNQLKDAEEAFLHVLDREPNHIEALKDISELKVRLGEEDTGWDYLTRIGWTQLLKDTEAVLRIGDAFWKNGSTEKAEEILSRYENFSPGDERIRRRLSRIYEEMGRLDEALAMIEGLDFDDPASDMSRKIQLNLQKGDRAEALQGIDELMNLQTERGGVDDLAQLSENLKLYEETTSSMLDENPEVWEKNLKQMSRTMRSIFNPPEQGEEPEIVDYSSFVSDSLSEDDTVSLLDINAMEPIIEINEDREIVYIEDAEEDFSDVYTEVLEEERRKQEKDFQDKSGYSQLMQQAMMPRMMAMAQQAPQMMAPMGPAPAQAPMQMQPVPVKAEVEVSLEADGEIALTGQAGIEVENKEAEDITDEILTDGKGFQEESILQEEDLFEDDQDEIVDFDDPPAGIEEEINPDDFLNEEDEYLDSDLEELLHADEESDLEEEQPEDEQIEDEDTPLEDAQEEFDQSLSTEIESLDIEEEEEILGEIPDDEPPPVAKEPLDEFPEAPSDELSEEDLLQEPPEPEVVYVEVPPPKPEFPVDRKSLANMFKYLSDLTDSLPAKEKSELVQKEVPLKMDMVRSKLEGKRSLLNTAAHFDRRHGDRTTEIAIDDEKLENTLSFFKDMSHQYPDQKVSVTFDKKLEHLLEKIRKVKKLNTK